MNQKTSYAVYRVSIDHNKKISLISICFLQTTENRDGEEYEYLRTTDTNNEVSSELTASSHTSQVPV